MIPDKKDKKRKRHSKDIDSPNSSKRRASSGAGKVSLSKKSKRTPKPSELFRVKIIDAEKRDHYFVYVFQVETIKFKNKNGKSEKRYSAT
eukprot:UN17898